MLVSKDVSSQITPGIIRTTTPPSFLMWGTSLVSCWHLIWANPSCRSSSSWVSCLQPAKTFFHSATRWHSLHVPVMSVFLRNSPSFIGSLSFTASDDITRLTHRWVLPTGLQNRPEWQTAGVGSRGAHPVYRRGALNLCIHCVFHHNDCDGSAVSWYDMGLHSEMLVSCYGALHS